MTLHALPLISGLLYAMAALFFKRAGQEGADPWRSMFVANSVCGLFYTTLWLLPSEHAGSWENVWHAVVSGTLFFAGQVGTFLALTRGQVSVATPVLGTKVLFVAFFAALVGAEKLTVGMWLAVVLTAVATALLGWQRGAAGKDIGRSLLYGFFAAACFGFTDVLQQKWIPLWGFPHYAATLFGTNALLSVFLLPVFPAPLRALPGAAMRPLCAGAVLIAVQSSGVCYAIFSIGATVTNVLYNTRGLWSVVLVWALGHWWGNVERSQGRAVMLRRLIASLLLLAAIGLALKRS